MACCWAVWFSFFVGRGLAEPLFCGARKCALSNLLHSHSTAPLLQGHPQQKFSQFLRYLRTKPSGERAQRTHFRAPQKRPPSSCKSDFHFRTLFTPSLIASLQQLFALFQRFPSSCCHMFAFQICIYRVFHSSLCKNCCCCGMHPF